jgi:hypothetical protein
MKAVTAAIINNTYTELFIFIVLSYNSLTALLKNKPRIKSKLIPINGENYLLLTQ